LDALVFTLMCVSPLIWLPLQAYALFRLRGRRRVFAALPILAMIPVLWITYAEYQKASNLWWLLLVFGSPLAALWVIATLFAGALNQALTLGTSAASRDERSQPTYLGLHVVAWICCLLFLLFARNAWLADQPPADMRLNDYFWYGIWFPSLALGFCIFAGYDLGRSARWFFAHASRSGSRAMSHGLRGTIVFGTVLLVRVSWLDVALFSLMLGASTFWPSNLPESPRAGAADSNER
jgi:hypothetical protein